MAQVGPLMIFDFDHTITDKNTDVEVQKLAPGGNIPQSSELRGLCSSQGWTQFMGAVFDLLHQNQTTQTEILSLMSGLDFVEGMDHLLHSVISDLSGTIIIISDSNSIFIDHILETKGCKDLISKVFTNPARWVDGKLLIEPYHDQDTCKLSTRNLCKGQIMEEYLAKCGKQFSFKAYVGDGKNDYCPSLRLSESDLVFARDGYSLQKEIQKESKDQNVNEKVKSKVCIWKSGEDILAEMKEKSGCQ